jgi:hypothetical protein
MVVLLEAVTIRVIVLFENLDDSYKFGAGRAIRHFLKPLTRSVESMLISATGGRSVSFGAL